MADRTYNNMTEIYSYIFIFNSIMSSVPVTKSPIRCACALLVSVSVALDSE